MRFERTDPCGSPGFKAGALSRTRPYFHVLRITPDKGHNAERREWDSDPRCYRFAGGCFGPDSAIAPLITKRLYPVNITSWLLLRKSEGLINSNAGQSELSVITPHHLPPALHFVGIKRLELLFPLQEPDSRSGASNQFRHTPIEQSGVCETSYPRFGRSSPYRSTLGGVRSLNPRGISF